MSHQRRPLRLSLTQSPYSSSVFAVESGHFGADVGECEVTTRIPKAGLNARGVACHCQQRHLRHLITPFRLVTILLTTFSGT